jgi:predicted alpha-1,6-mannanase (GH76 family)
MPPKPIAESRRYRGGKAIGFGLHSFLRVTICALVLQLARSSSGQTAVSTYHNRADQALQSFLLKFWNGNQQYLRSQFPDNGGLTGYWTFANGWDAVMDGVERSGGEHYLGLIETFYAGQDERGWFAGYYDDECWMSLALMRAYDLTGYLKYLNQAEILYADIMAGWDTTCCGPNKGGMWWDKAHTQKATAANAGTALVGARLYQRTGYSTYLAFAEQVYSFWYANMVSPSAFQVCDHINTDGTKVWWKFTYNEGLMVGAGVELYKSTGDTNYLVNANNIAHFMVTQEVRPSAYGSVLYDGSNSGCGGDCHQFKGPAYRYLSLLYGQDSSRTEYRTVLKACADSLWNLARDTNSTVFAINWLGPAQTTVDQDQDNAACVALSRFAQINGGYPGSGVPANQYEAENSVLHHVLLEGIYGSFTGWGYIAGWNADGQWIDFKVNCATAGTHTLTFRYAAGAGTASRVIQVNGNVLVSNQTFPNTGTWSTYNTASVPCDLPAGQSTISVIYDSTQKSSNWLNLDNLSISGDPPEQIYITGINILANGNTSIAWSTRAGQRYRVQYRGDLTTGSWSDFGIPITATGTTTSVEDGSGQGQQRYYQIVAP